MARDPFPFDVAQPKKPRRNLLITLALLAIIIFYGANVVILLGLPLVGKSLPPDVPVQPEAWMTPMAGLLSLGYVAGAVGVWWWRRWGLTLMWSTALTTLATELIFTGSIGSMLIGSVIMLLGAIAAMIWVRVKHAHFD